MSDQINSKRDSQFDYNSQRSDLIIPEYGRHVQGMIQYIKTIPEIEKRQLYVERIVRIMLQIFPQTKNQDDYKEKIWKHIFRIANYELDVTPPDGISIKKPDELSRPEMIEYPHNDTKYRHYGNHVQHLIDKASTMEDPEMQAEFLKTIGAYMKLAYKNWSREHVISDEMIKQDIVNMSKGKLKMGEETSLDHLTNPSNQKRRKRNPSSGSHSSNQKRSNFRQKRR